MNKFSILSLVFFLFSLLHSQDTWVQTYQPFYNPAGDNDYYVEDVIVCDDGGYAVNGYYWYFEDWIEEQWGYLMKTDSDGNFLWAKKDTVSWIDETESSAFVQTDDGGYLSSVYSLWGGTALIKRDSEGNREWVSNCGDLYIHSMDKTNDGNIILAGRMNGLPAIRKIAQNADIHWTQSYAYNDETDGCINSVCSASDNGYLATGYVDKYDTGEIDVLVVKTNEIGDSLWTRSYDGNGGLDKGSCILETDDEIIFVSGYFNGVGGFLLRILNTGNVYYLNYYDSYIFGILENTTNELIIGRSRTTLYAFLKENGDTLWSTILPTGLMGNGDKAFQLIDDGFICAGENWEGIVLTKTDTTGNVTAIDNNEMLHIEIKLNCFPNPFNPHTTINYELPDGKVRSEILIYNIRGQLIKTLPIDNTKTSVNWKPQDCSSGIYFYKMDIEKTPVKKMLLLK